MQHLISFESPEFILPVIYCVAFSGFARWSISTNDTHKPTTRHYTKHNPLFRLSILHHSVTDDEDGDGPGSYWGEYLYLAQFAGDSDNHKSPLNGSLSRRNGQNYPCLKCGRWYSTKSIMLRHMNHECGVEKKIQCTICLKRFRRKWNLEQHIKRLHPVWLGNAGRVGYRAKDDHSRVKRGVSILWRWNERFSPYQYILI